MLIENPLSLQESFLLHGRLFIICSKGNILCFSFIKDNLVWSILNRMKISEALKNMKIQNNVGTCIHSRNVVSGLEV
jgi:hypothetical protein